MIDRKNLTWIISGIGLLTIFVGPVLYYLIVK